MAFQLPITDPDTGSQYPNAYVSITDATVSLANNAAEVVLSTFASAETAGAGLKPVMPSQSVVLTSAEIGSLRAQFATVLYQILRQRPEWADAQDV